MVVSREAANKEASEAAVNRVAVNRVAVSKLVVSKGIKGTSKVAAVKANTKLRSNGNVSRL